MLVVVAVAPDSDLAGTLTQDLGYGLAGRVQRAEAEPSMAYTDRVERLLSCCRTFPGGPSGSREARRRSRRSLWSRTGRLAELGPETATTEAVTVVDAVADAVVPLENRIPALTSVFSGFSRLARIR